MYNDNDTDDPVLDDKLVDQLRRIVGPCGSSIILDNGGLGSLQLTRDGYQILHACHNNDKSFSGLRRILLKICLNVGDKYGDGTISTVLIIDYLLKQISNVNNIRRIRVLQAYEVIRHVFICNKDKITEYLINIGIWKSLAMSSSSYINNIRGLLSNVLYPATNSKLANIVIDMIMSWLKLSNDENTLSKCYYALKNFDDLIICSESASSSGEISDSYPLSLDSIMIENARCKDLSKLRKSSDKLFQFICINSLLVKPTDDRITTISLSSLSLLSNKTSHRLLYVSTLITYMQQHNISVVVSCEEVDDDIYNALTTADIVIIDRVALPYLQRLAELSKTVVWSNISEIQRYIYDTSCEDKIDHTYGIFDNVIMIKTSKFNSHLFIRGIGKSRLIESTNHQVSQLFLICNAASMGMLTRLIKRCLKYIITLHQSNLGNTLVITAGAGATDIEWSNLFHKISDTLNKDYVDTHSNENNSKLSLTSFIVENLKQYTLQKYNKTLFNDIANVCLHISKAYKEMPRNIIKNSFRSRLIQRNFNIDKVLLDWSKCNSPVLGYVVNNDDEIMKSGLLCDLQSSFNPDNLVVSSGPLFWYTFFTTIEAMILFLRTGGSNSIVNIKSSSVKKGADDDDDGKDNEDESD